MAVSEFSGPAIVSRVGHDISVDVSRRDASGEQVEHRFVPTLPESQVRPYVAGRYGLSGRSVFAYPCPARTSRSSLPLDRKRRLFDRRWAELVGPHRGDRASCVRQECPRWMGCGREAPNRAAGVLRRAFPHDPDPRQAERRAVAPVRRTRQRAFIRAGPAPLDPDCDTCRGTREAGPDRCLSRRAISRSPGRWPGTAAGTRVRCHRQTVSADGCHRR